MATLTAPETLPPAVEVSDAERDALLAIARSAVAAAVRRAPNRTIEAGTMPTVLEDRRGAAFVTLLEHGELRGCVGLLDPTRPLAESVAVAAVGAALRDDRFLPVIEDELPSIEIEISVLGPFVELDDPLAFRPGIDGLLVARGFARGLLLPEVATSHGLDATAMLDATCWKAGLAASTWRDPKTTVFAFRTERFGGPAIA
jgi:AmmeMemoRadiSam system protein A